VLRICKVFVLSGLVLFLAAPDLSGCGRSGFVGLEGAPD
jgi:hypothetical protein